MKDIFIVFYDADLYMGLILWIQTHNHSLENTQFNVTRYKTYIDHNCRVSLQFNKSLSYLFTMSWFFSNLFLGHCSVFPITINFDSLKKRKIENMHVKPFVVFTMMDN